MKKTSFNTIKTSVTSTKRSRGMMLSSTALFIVAAIAALSSYEMQSFSSQARYFADLSREFSVWMAPAANTNAYYPTTGPYDTRLGYVQLPSFLDRLQNRDYTISAQARLSVALRNVIDEGAFPIYREKYQAGLTISDSFGVTMRGRQYPERTYAFFKSIPNILVDTLLYIENRELLDQQSPERNPAVEWDRLVKVSGDVLLDTVLTRNRKQAGGSTLATQIEKYRHSSGGFTANPREKLRQMASATLRAYLEGENTIDSRRRIVRDYINTVPLSARKGYGEVNGIGDGLWAWYGTDFTAADRLLSREPAPNSTEEFKRAVVYKQVLSLFLAQRRPSFYLANAAELERLVERYLVLLANDGVITRRFARVVRSVNLQARNTVALLDKKSFVDDKAVDGVRHELLRLLGVASLYDLDRLDLSVKATLQQDVQRTVTRTLRQLKDPNYARAQGLYGKYLLKDGDRLENVVYSFTLMERTEKGNAVRVQADNLDQPLDVNQGVKLDLGSSAKLRTLVTYLEVIAELYRQYQDRTSEQLRRVSAESDDVLSQWVIQSLTKEPKVSLQVMLERALDRKYAANPNEYFFTGGGQHTFANFSDKEDHKVMTIRYALRHSVNLVFVRLMRDIVKYYIHRDVGSMSALLANQQDDRRLDFLEGFAAMEGKKFLRRFYGELNGKSQAQIFDSLMRDLKPRSLSLAVAYKSMKHDASVDEIKNFISRALPTGVVSKPQRDLADTITTIDDLSWTTRGALTGLHPLKLWLAGYLSQHATASLADAMEASVSVRRDVYTWLYKTRRKHAQDKRIFEMLERAAFTAIHRQWVRVGYPFDQIVPSLATALGSSADRPAALAELMGIIVNEGRRLPSYKVSELHFASNTPYETLVERTPAAGEQVIAPEVAATLKHAIRDVVDRGTARRASGVLIDEQGGFISIGGKTGTGDHRYKEFNEQGLLVDSRVMNRAATFVFYIGDRFFGTVTAFVPGEQAADYSFTSSLPVQILKLLAPALQPLVVPRTTTRLVNREAEVSRSSS